MKKPVKSLTAAQKRVLIAKDTIKWLNSNNIEAKSGEYFLAPSMGIKIKSLNDKLGAALARTKKSCKVCALGGMFYSMVRRFDKVTVGRGDITNRCLGDYLTFVESSVVFSELGKYFPHHQLAMIESAFEMIDMIDWEDHDHIGDAEVDRSILFAQKPDYSGDGKSPASRLRMIMENVVENNGVFKP